MNHANELELGEVIDKVPTKRYTASRILAAILSVCCMVAGVALASKSALDIQQAANVVTTVQLVSDPTLELPLPLRPQTPPSSINGVALPGRERLPLEYKLIYLKLVGEDRCLRQSNSAPTVPGDGLHTESCYRHPRETRPNYIAWHFNPQYSHLVQRQSGMCATAKLDDTTNTTYLVVMEPCEIEITGHQQWEYQPTATDGSEDHFMIRSGMNSTNDSPLCMLFTETAPFEYGPAVTLVPCTGGSSNPSVFEFDIKHEAYFALRHFSNGYCLGLDETSNVYLEGNCFDEPDFYPETDHVLRLQWKVGPLGQLINRKTGKCLFERSSFPHLEHGFESGDCTGTVSHAKTGGRFASVVGNYVDGYQILLESGKCLGLATVQSSTGNRFNVVRSLKCEQRLYKDSDQAWEANFLRPLFQLRSRPSGRCLDVQGPPGMTPGLKVQLYDCDTSIRVHPSDQFFTMDNKQFRSFVSGLCLDVEGEQQGGEPVQMANGASIQVATCEPPSLLLSDQQWNLYGSHATGFRMENVIPLEPKKCLDIKGIIGYNNEDLAQVWDCDEVVEGSQSDMLWDIFINVRTLNP